MMGGMFPGPGVKTYGISLPPFHEDLLVWLKGDTTDTERVDSYTSPIDAAMVLEDSPCLLMDGTDSITMAGHGTIISYEGSGTPSYDDTTLTCTAGTLYHVEFSDGTIWAFAERSATAIYVFDTTGVYSGVISTTNLALMRSGRQDEYHFNTVEGWWEINGDDTLYPYAVDGFDTYHAGSTWNGSEVKQIFKERGVGTFDGVDDFIETDFSTINKSKPLSFYFTCADTTPAAVNVLVGWDHRDINAGFYLYIHSDRLFISLGVSGSLIVNIFSNIVYKINMILTDGALQVYVNDTLEFSSSSSIVQPNVNCLIGARHSNDGTVGDIDNSLAGIWDVNINGLLIPLTDGQVYGDDTTDIHDSDGTVVGSLSSGNVETFWSQTILDPILVAMDEIPQLLTDLSGDPVDLLESEIHAGCNNNKQYYSVEGGQKLFYDSVQSDANDLIIKNYLGL